MRVYLHLSFFSLLIAGFATSVRGQTMNCSSEDGKRHYCSADTSQGVQLIKQRSGSPCTQGYSWDYNSQGIWVDHGCRADFFLQAAAPPDSGKTIYCASDDGNRNYCNAETRAGVRLVRQRSDAACARDYSWGFDDRGIWVDHGCRADFALEVGPPGYDDSVGSGKIISCSSDDGKRNYCQAEIRAGVQMIKQRSGSPCTRDYSWGFDEQGIWVDHGCRADFALETRRDQDDRDRDDHDRDGNRDRYNNDSGKSCLRTVGRDRANALVNQCLQVSTATHPPCNVDNSCTLINDEIRRGCAMLGRDAPSFCDQYR